MKSGVKQDNPIQIFGEGYPVEKKATQESKSTAKERTTNAQVAKLAGVSDETIRKVEKIEEKATPEVKAAVKSGEEIAQSAQVECSLPHFTW